MHITHHPTIGDFTQEEWEILERGPFPFTRYGFLQSLEEGGALGERSGWYPSYRAIRKDGVLLGVYICFVKTNSYGEYIFDWAWADAYERNQIPYYPKLVAAIPFTPASGPKLLVHPTANREVLLGLFLQEIKQECSQGQYSSFHAFFITEPDLELYRKAGLMIRNTLQFHWHNNGYRQFDCFLEALRKKRRKEIKRERKQLDHSGLSIRIESGSEFPVEDIPILHNLYMQTIDKRQAFNYLTEESIRRIFANSPETILVATARDQGKLIAMALAFQDEKNLYGRYWGTRLEVPYLHFELCYYQFVDYAIRNNCNLFEAGAQGPHKIGRGFLPCFTYSAHHIAHPQFREAIHQAIMSEKNDLTLSMQQFASSLPFPRENLPEFILPLYFEK